MAVLFKLIWQAFCKRTCLIILSYLQVALVSFLFQKLAQYWETCSSKHPELLHLYPATMKSIFELYKKSVVLSYCHTTWIMSQRQWDDCGKVHPQLGLHAISCSSESGYESTNVANIVAVSSELVSWKQKTDVKS